MALVEVVRDDRMNAAVGWLLLGIVALDGFYNLLRNVPLWGGFELLLVIVASIPALAARDWTVTIPWLLSAVAALSVVARTAGAPFEVTAYLAIATLALIVVVELEAFAPVELSRRFAVFFAVLTTMAIQALWTVAQFYSDRWLGTDFLHSQTELQWDFVVVTAVGVVLAGAYQVYVTRSERADDGTRSTSDGGEGSV
ncbi:hypothetical protein [Halopiger xanaduensis]|uniref:Uncharacterized protein n=1 Tax=Halopiger xanaduensis (strain DSM 18323 / JCM 14033 / SH-6) TaxID=797210 RepID=F8D5Z7_HALXS|nr:hypothetical protein [Halopiger xanaduensis]AEH37726.1 hypothetical protein Halxa_3112 [Halopiger xanaduensis SH-6]